MPEFGYSSETRLQQAHEDLQKIFRYVIKYVDCSVIWAFRGEAEQNQAFKDGTSKLKWPKSKHNVRPSLAVDVVPYPIDWTDLRRFDMFGRFVIAVADMMLKNGEINNKIEWGGDWATFKDRPHFQIK